MVRPKSIIGGARYTHRKLLIVSYKSIVDKAQNGQEKEQQSGSGHCTG